MGIIHLLRQVPAVTVPRKKLWRLSKEEVRSSFIGRVNTASDIERYCVYTYILAVGTSWATVSHYEIVIHNGLRYQMPCDNVINMIDNRHFSWRSCKHNVDLLGVNYFIAKCSCSNYP